LLEQYAVDAVFDIGANSGMSGEFFRNIGFRGRIVSFEPVAACFRALQQKATGDPLWLCENAAIGDREGEAEINVTGAGGAASSLLRMTPEVTRRAPELAVVGRERVRMTTLDAAARKHYPSGDRLFLKLDVQGYERPLLEAACEALDRVVGMRIELSLIQSYDGAALLGDMIPFLGRLGFRLAGIDPAWSDPRTQEVFELDGMFVRTERAR
jgi:FkbM family methyltransferase